MTDTIGTQVKRVEFSDLRKALRLGFADFRALPQYGLFFGGFYAFGGILLIILFFKLNIEWAIYPIAIGFILIGPFVASGLYEVSRRRELDMEITWRNILGVIWDQRNRELGWMAFVLLFVFWIWMYQARTIFVIFFGFKGFASLEGFVDAVFNSTNGLYFLIIGNVVGAIISLILFSLTVISCPMLLDKEVDFVTAMLTSVRIVFKSPLVMITWGVLIILSVLLSMTPLFLGLIITFPIFGHSTWHLYRICTGDTMP